MILKQFNSKIEIIGTEEELRIAKKLLYIYYPHPQNKALFQSVYLGRKNSFPAGYLSQFEIKAKKKNIHYSIEDHRDLNYERIKLKYNAPYELMTHQKEAVEAIKNNTVGIISSPTGSGKSLMIGATIAEHCASTLIICPTTDIKDNLAETFGEMFGHRNVSSVVPIFPWIPGVGETKKDEASSEESTQSDNPFDYLLKPKKTKLKSKNSWEDFRRKQIESVERKRNSNKWFKPITVVCWHSIPNLPKEYIKRVSCIIVDECHTSAIKDIRKLLYEAESAIFRYGFSATPWRDQPHLFKLMQSALGSDVIYDYPVEEAIEDNVVAKPNLNIIEASFPEKFLKKSRNYREIIDFGIIRNKARNQQIVKKAIELYDDNNRVFIAINEIGQYEGKSVVKIKNINGEKVEVMEIEEDTSYCLKTLFEEKDVPVFFVSGDTSKKEKKEIISRLEETENGFILIGTMAIGIGTDIPPINKIIMGSTTTKNESIKFIQRIGRGMRTGGEKGKELEVFDFMDRWNALTKKYTIDRIKIFSKHFKGCKVFGF